MGYREEKENFRVNLVVSFLLESFHSHRRLYAPAETFLMLMTECFTDRFFTVNPLNSALSISLKELEILTAELTEIPTSVVDRCVARLSSVQSSQPRKLLVG